MTQKSEAGDLVALLKAPHFGQPAVPEPAATLPVVATMRMLTLDELVEYDQNPRVQPNAEWDMLRASYLKTGAENTVLVVTRRPRENHYFPAAGGNTRLRVLKHLWEATRDKRFYRVNCQIIPYADEKAIVVAHLVENDNRADYVFIDRAEAVCRLYDWLNEESGGTLSQRAFIERMIALGYPKLSRRHLSRYQYAVKLHPYIPQALDGGLGGRTLDRIVETQGLLTRFLEAACAGASEMAEKVEALWPHVLQTFDSPEGIDPAQAVPGVFEQLAPVLSEYSARVGDDLITSLVHLWRDWESDPSQSVSLRQETVAKKPASSHEHSRGARVFTADERARYARERGLDVVTESEPDLVTLAKTFAGHFRLESLVGSLDREGRGFWVDLPLESDQIEDQSACAWWWLFLLAEGASPVKFRDPALRRSRVGEHYRQIANGGGTRSRKELKRMSQEARERAVQEELQYIIESIVPRPPYPEQALLWPNPAGQALHDLTRAVHQRQFELEAGG